LNSRQPNAAYPLKAPAAETAPHATYDQRDDKQNESNEEYDLRNSHRRASYAAESEESGYQRYD